MKNPCCDIASSHRYTVYIQYTFIQICMQHLNVIVFACVRTSRKKNGIFADYFMVVCVCVLVRASVCIYFRINLWCVRRAYAWWWWRISKRIESCYLYICMKYCAHVAWRRGGRVDGKTSQCQHIMCAARRAGWVVVVCAAAPFFLLRPLHQLLFT